MKCKICKQEIGVHKDCGSLHFENYREEMFEKLESRYQSEDNVNELIVNMILRRK